MNNSSRWRPQRRTGGGTLGVLGCPTRSLSFSWRHNRRELCDLSRGTVYPVRPTGTTEAQRVPFFFFFPWVLSSIIHPEEGRRRRSFWADRRAFEDSSREITAGNKLEIEEENAAVSSFCSVQMPVFVANPRWQNLCLILVDIFAASCLIPVLFSVTYRCVTFKWHFCFIRCVPLKAIWGIRSFQQIYVGLQSLEGE